MPNRRRAVLGVLLICFGTSTPALADLVDAGEDAERLILRKLAEDRAYFLWRVRQQEQGEAPEDIDAGTLRQEVRRARVLLPIIDHMIDAARSQPAGERVDLTRVPARNSPTYHQLALYLNLVGAVRAGDYPRAEALSRQIDLSVGFGPTQSIDGYRVRLTRHYYYLRAVALYHLHEDEGAVQWLGQISQDAEVRDLNLEKRREVDNIRLAGLSERPVAVAGFVPDEEDEAHAWIGAAVSDAVLNDLVNFSDLQVVERRRIDELFLEMELGMLGVVDERQAVQVGHLVEAATLVYGSYGVRDGVVTLHGRLVHVESGAVLQSSIVQAAESAVYAAARELTLEMLGAQGLLSAVERQRIAGGRVPSEVAVRAVAQARMLAANQPDAARALFEEAMQNDPAYANAHEQLRAEFADVTATVAILPFENVTRHEEDAWMSEGIAEILAGDVATLGFSTVERLQLMRLLEYQAALAADEVMTGTDLDTVLQVGGQAAANFVVVGSFQRLGEDLRANLRFLDVKTGQVLYTAAAQGARADYARVVAELVARLGEHVGRKLTEEELAAMVEGKPTLEEFERFMRQELARERLALDEARQEGETDREREARLATERLQAAIGERVAQAERATLRRRQLAIGGIGAGVLVAGLGHGLGSVDRHLAGENLALAEHALHAEDSSRFQEQAVYHHRRANTWLGVGLVGLAGAAASAGYLFFARPVPPDLDGLDPGLAVGSAASVRAGPTPRLDGAALVLDLRW